MAYNKVPIRVIAGGLNKVGPGDEISDDDSQELLNWSLDSQGALRSRKGHTNVCSAGGGVTKMLRGMGARWQGGAGGVFRECGAVLPGGSPIGMMSWQGFMWAMGSDQRKSEGSNNLRWIPEAPKGKPTAKPQSVVETPVVDFSSGWLVDPTGDDTYNPTLQIHASADDNSYSAVKEAVIDLGSGHDLDDVHRVRVWSKNWTRIKEVVFELDCNDGSFTKDYFTARMTKKEITGGLKEEISFYLRARPQNVDIAAQDKKRYGWFTRIGSTPEKGWKTVGMARVKVTFIETTKMRFDEWVCVGNEDNTLEGDDLSVCYTYTTAKGHESNPSNFSNPITCNRQGIAVTDMVASGDPQVTGINVYLTGNTLQAVYQVNRDGPIAGTSYNINSTFDKISDFGKNLEIDHDDPPAATGLAGPYFGRAIAYKGSKVWWSKLDKPYAFPGADDEIDGNWNQINEQIGDLLSHTQRTQMMWLYGTNGVVILVGDPDDITGSFHNSAVQMGIASQAGVVQAPEGDYVNFSGGIYFFAGDSAKLISYKINPVFESFNRSAAALGYQDAVVWASDGQNTWKWDVSTDRWFEDSRVFSCFYGDGNGLLGALTDGTIVNLESGFTDGGAAIPLLWKSKFYDAGILDNEKQWEDVTIWADTAGADLAVTLIFNDGEFSKSLGVITSGAKERFVLQLNPGGEGIRARNVCLLVTGSTTGETVIHEVALNYYPKAREGKSFDTGEIDLGDHRVKRLRELIIDIDNPEEVLLTIKSDRPQPMANRSTSHIIASTSDRRMQPVVLKGEDIIGRLFRIVEHGGDFRSYGGKILYQAFGTYLEDGEYYLSDPMDFGTEKVKLLHEMEVIYEGAGGLLTVRTDLPGNAISDRGTAILPPVTGEQSIKVRTSGLIKGRLYEIQFDPSGPTRIEAIRLEIKIVGSPNATPWTWVPLPLIGTTDAIWATFGFPPDQVG